MRVLGLLLLLGAAGGAHHWWGMRAEAAAQARLASGPNGFVEVMMPPGTRPGTVVVLAPVNCPSEAARRADALAAALSRQGIPTVRSSRYEVDLVDPTPAQIAAVQQAATVMRGEIPAVFLDGAGAANPTLAEVVAEYRRTRR